MTGITNPVEHFFKDGLWGWDLTQWRKLPLIFGYSATAFDRIVNQALTAGTNNLDLTAVPTGYVRVITGISFFYTGTPPTRADIQIVSGAPAYIVYRQLIPATTVVYDRQGWWVLGAGDFVRLNITGATAADTASVYTTGFAMAIAQ